MGEHDYINECDQCGRPFQTVRVFPDKPEHETCPSCRSPDDIKRLRVALVSLADRVDEVASCVDQRSGLDLHEIAQKARESAGSDKLHSVKETP